MTMNKYNRAKATSHTRVYSRSSLGRLLYVCMSVIAMLLVSCVKPREGDGNDNANSDSYHTRADHNELMEVRSIEMLFCEVELSEKRIVVNLSIYNSTDQVLVLPISMLTIIQRSTGFDPFGHDVRALMPQLIFECLSDSHALYSGELLAVLYNNPTMLKLVAVNPMDTIDLTMSVGLAAGGMLCPNPKGFASITVPMLPYSDLPDSVKRSVCFSRDVRAETRYDVVMKERVILVELKESDCMRVSYPESNDAAELARLVSYESSSTLDVKERQDGSTKYHVGNR